MMADEIGQERVYRVDRQEPRKYRVTVRDGHGLAPGMFTIRRRRYYEGETQAAAYRKAVSYARDRASGHSDRRVDYGHGVEPPEDADENGGDAETANA